MSGVKGKAAIVTGGSKGYGYGIAEALKSGGAEVWITSRHQDELQRAAERLGVNSCKADATRGEDWDRLIREVTDRTGTVDVLINNAGGGIKKASLVEQTDEEIERSIALNLTAAILGSKRVVPFMKKQKSGTIINISSICAREAWPGWSVYSAAKVGLSLFSQCLYLEVQDFGVRITTLIPSWGETDFLAAANVPQRDPDTEKRVTKPRELGDLVVQICELPDHLEILDLTVLPMVQKIAPM
jgi:NAD(P)-dependent dehydrogenase (short-subunit alcohol dehydrogenase family)